MSKAVAVFGIGRFGLSLVNTLYDSGIDVMAVDGNPAVIEKMQNKATYAMVADLKDADSIKGLGLENMDVVVVAMGSDLQASIMSVMVSKEVGVPLVMAKAADERMGQILKKVGADKVLFPEEESGSRTARILMSDSFLEFFDIDENLCLVEIKAKKEWVGKNLMELDFRKKYKMNVIAIKDKNKAKSFVDPNKPLEEDSELIVVIDKSDLKKLK